MMTTDYILVVIPAIITFVLSCILLSTKKHRDHERQEEKFLFIICLLNMVAQVFYTASDFLELVSIDGIRVYLWYTSIVFLIIAERFTLIITILWVILVDYLCNGSMDHIRRTYGWLVIPVVITAMLLFVIEPWTYAFSENEIFSVLYNLSCGFDIFFIYAMQSVLLIKAYLILWDYDRKRKPPRDLKLIYIILPAVINTVLFFFTSLPRTDAVWTVVAMYLVLNCLKKRDRYIDRETGFYNISFLRVMNDHLEEKGFFGGSAMVVHTAAENKMQVSEIMSKQCPIDGERFILADGQYLYLTSSQTEGNLQFLCKNLEMAAKLYPSPFEIHTTCTTRQAGESIENYTERLIRLSAF